MSYDFLAIEKKWQDIWEKENAFAAKKAKQSSESGEKKKYYALVEFPYPSGQGLHVGHPRSYTALDILARKRRMQGYNVLYPMGWDAFGLPTENYAIANHIPPDVVTEKNIANFKKQMRSFGFSFDWNREINTTDPAYYHWTQWIFLQLFKHGLAYKKEMAVNWCTSCKCVLANEEVVGGKCERCGSDVVQKKKSQWMLKITAYADKLLEDLNLVDYIKPVKVQQRNWIGKSEGAEITFETTASKPISVFTTRPDTLFGVSYMVLSPEHPFLKSVADLIQNPDEIKACQEEAARKSEFERSEMNKEKTGVLLRGVEAIHPITGKKVPIFLSDYVLMGYGTGAIMAVPAHDQRDYDFAKKFDLPIIQVLSGGDLSEGPITETNGATLINSEFLNGKTASEAQSEMISFLEKNGKGKRKVQYKLRDWIFARQRYWGEPIPIIHCEDCGMVPLPESELPLTLPPVESYEPTEDGESPLSKIEEFVHTTCPKCGKPALRETDTMPQWAGSSWYFLRFCDPHNVSALAAKEALDYWMPVDWYDGGMEHTTLHLLYSRFWHKFLYDIGVVSCPEPYQKRTSHGMILGENGDKMSKSRGNVINPDDIIRDYGADTLRLYEMFIGDFEKSAPWSTSSIKGCKRFLERIWNLQESVIEGGIRKEIESDLHRTIQKVSEDIEQMKYNTAISALMSFLNVISEKSNITKEEYKVLLLLLNPFAPHITEELYQRAGFEGRIYQQSWPTFDPEKCKVSEIEMVVQINGKLRSKFSIKVGATKEEILQMAKEDPKTQEYLAGKEIVKEIYVPNKLVNFVIR